MQDQSPELTEQANDAPIVDQSDTRTDFQKWSDSFRTKRPLRFFHKSSVVSETEDGKRQIRTSSFQKAANDLPKGKRAKRLAKRQRVAERKQNQTN
jgi:hypothetical protein